MCCEIPGLHAHEIAALRRAAAMAHTVAGIALTLRSEANARQRDAGRRTVRRPIRRVRYPLLSPCGFRNAVAKARDRSRTRATGRVDRSGLLRRRRRVVAPPARRVARLRWRADCSGRVETIWAMASLLPPDTARRGARRRGRRAGDVVLRRRRARSPHGPRRAARRVDRSRREPSGCRPTLVAAVDEVIRRFIATTASRRADRVTQPRLTPRSLFGPQNGRHA